MHTNPVCTAVFLFVNMIMCRWGHVLESICSMDDHFFASQSRSCVSLCESKVMNLKWTMCLIIYWVKYWIVRISCHTCVVQYLKIQNNHHCFHYHKRKTPHLGFSMFIFSIQEKSFINCLWKLPRRLSTSSIVSSEFMMQSLWENKEKGLLMSTGKLSWLVYSTYQCFLATLAYVWIFNNSKWTQQQYSTIVIGQVGLKVMNVQILTETLLEDAGFLACFALV